MAWFTGAAFIFPSLGPTAYLLASDEQFSYSANTVIGGHACGVIGGWVSYHVIAAPYDMMHISGAMSYEGLMLVSGSVIAIILTIVLMLLFNASHPPACATTLIVSLGILPSWQDSILIVLAVTGIYLTYLLYQKGMSSS